ncbi:MAG: ribonuclease J [Lachnospiraceae bacterium]|nr:ribonuclease J [Lachnospiraceae bacterium]
MTTNRRKNNTAAPRRPRKSVKIIPLGGLDQIGQNMTLIECENEIVIIDCGLAFPGDEMPGIDLIIPNFEYLRQNQDKIKGVVLTHGHEDHIGALPYFLREFRVPVYGTRLTLGLVRNKMEEFNLKSYTLTMVKPGDVVELGHMKVEFIRTNHSIGDAVALAISTAAGVLVHTGDFKLDYTPIHGDMIDLQRFAELGHKKVLALMSDSTNAERKGYTMSERTVGSTFTEMFPQAQGRILVATFASNVDRVQQIINAAIQYGRKVVCVGRSMVNVINTALELNYLEVPDGVLIDISDMKNYDDDELVIITTGSQGEPMAALSRMASGEHKAIEIKEGDTVIFSSKPVPGNEKMVSRVINDLMVEGAKVTYEDAHVSGHASQEELKMIYSLVKPKYFLPVHGEYRHLRTHADLIKGLGHDERNAIIMCNGNVLELDSYSAKVSGYIDVEPVLVDGLGVGDVGNIVLRDRKILSQDGLMIVVIGLHRGSGEVVAGPDIVSRGFVYVKESEVLMESCRAVVSHVLAGNAPLNVMDWNNIKALIRDSLRDHLWREIKRSPMILPIIMEVKG